MIEFKEIDKQKDNFEDQMKIPYSEGSKTTVYIGEKINNESVVLMVLVSGK